MIIQSFPQVPLIDPGSKSGLPHPLWQEWFSQIAKELQNNLSNEGIQHPSQPQTNVSLLNTPQSIGRTIYNSDSQFLNVNNQGTYRQLTTMDAQNSAQIAATPPTEVNNTWKFNTDTNQLLVGINGVFRQVAYI